MNDYFDDVSVNGYQAQDASNAADGNYRLVPAFALIGVVDRAQR